MEFQDIFKQLRKDRGIGQVALAEALGVSKGVISFWETGRNEPSLQMLKKIAVYFEVTTDYLVGLENEDGTKVH
ncbi:MAG: helix-turn-helix transcriptional regulator [Clostridia bacterium]|nr:helix-turn-helix transcriptional regulator [Clostridia bacterium]